MFDVEKIVEDLNNTNLKLQDIANNLNLSKRTITRKIKESGYVYSRKDKKYYLQDENYFLETEIKCKDKKEIFNKTVGLTKETIKALRVKAVIEEKLQNDIVEEALKQFIEEKYFNM